MNGKITWSEAGDREPLTELTDDHREILRFLTDADGDDELPELADVHDYLVELEETSFIASPEWGDGWNSERRAVQTHLRRLEATDFTSTNGKGHGWSITAAGRILIDELERERDSETER